jgi:hypothetical protein
MPLWAHDIVREHYSEADADLICERFPEHFPNVAWSEVGSMTVLYYADQVLDMELTRLGDRRS